MTGPAPVYVHLYKYKRYPYIAQYVYSKSEIKKKKIRILKKTDSAAGG